MDEQTQYEVAQGLKEGSREAWLTLYDAYADVVWRNVARLTGGSNADVADIVQETFLAAACSARTFDSRRSLEPWLCGIARHQVALYYRRQEQRRKLAHAVQWWTSLDGDCHCWIAGRVEAPPDVVASRELATLVRAALSDLPPEYQMLLTAQYLRGASGEQIACEMGCSRSAVWMRLSRARRAFKRVFNKISNRS